MEIFLEIFILSSALFFILFPLFQKGVKDKGEKTAPLHDLISKKEAIYRSIKELEMDYKMGKLSFEDYQELSDDLKKDAASILEEIEKNSKLKTQNEKFQA